MHYRSFSRKRNINTLVTVYSYSLQLRHRRVLGGSFGDMSQVVSRHFAAMESELNTADAVSALGRSIYNWTCSFYAPLQG